MREVSIYIASGIKGLRKQNGYIGYCLEYYPEGSKYAKTLIDYEPVEDMTGKRSELEALIKALKRMREKCILSIYTESTYLNMGLGEQRLVDKWVKSGWTTGKNVEVKNRDKWQELLNLLNGSLYQIHLKETNAYVKMLQIEAEKKGEIRNV